MTTARTYIISVILIMNIDALTLCSELGIIPSSSLFATSNDDNDNEQQTVDEKDQQVPVSEVYLSVFCRALDESCTPW
jgi:hypothetical protein